ncbi:MAG TPA: hypothetical protein VGG32_06895 [Thermoplasmata archaeon]|jgi:hypothetical protein
MKRISRGLLATAARPILPTGMDPEELAERRITTLATDPPKGYHWRETYEWAARLYRGDGDDRGRRIFSDAGRSDARYVSRVAHRAALGRGLPSTPREWGHLRKSIERLHAELNEK